MPDRLIHTAKGVLDGLLMIHGTLYMVLGWSWVAYPSPGRLAGIHWLPLAVTEHHVGWWWIIGGALAAAGAALSRCRWMHTLAVMAAVGTPLVLSLIFAAAWFTGQAPRGLITAVSYGSWAVVVAWASVRTSLDALRAVRDEERA